MFWDWRVLYACVHKCVQIQFLHVCADSEARKIWYVGLTTERHVWGLLGNSDKLVLWPLAFLCQNSTSGAQEQRIVGHGNVYLPCSHPDQQLCSSGPEKHWLCKLSLSHTHSDWPCFCSVPKKLKPESIETTGRTLFSVYALTLPLLSWYIYILCLNIK